MTKTYEKQGQNSEPVVALEEAMAVYHDRLVKADVHIDVLMVSEIDAESGEVLPALKLHGYPCAATIKIVSPAQRALGQGDALLTIDATAWRELSLASRTAMLDHELMHLELVHKDGELKRDDLGRPKLKMRLHDYELGGFVEVIDRHKAASLEVITVKSCRGANGQLYWDFAPKLKSVA